LVEAAREQKAKCDAELAEAVPAMQAAEEAVNCLDVKSIQELKALGRPPQQVKEVCAAVMILKEGVLKNQTWADSQRMMKQPKKFIQEIKAFDGNNIDAKRLKAVRPYLSQDWFNFDVMRSKSAASAYLCAWVVNIVTYNTIYKKIKPLQDAAD